MAVRVPDRSKQGRTSGGRFTRTLEAAERDGKACALYARGWKLADITTHLGYSSPANCFRGIRQALAETSALHGGRELREAMIIEAAELRQRMWEIIDSPPPALDRSGKPATTADGETVPDAQAMIGAAQVVLKAQDRLARLTGADAPRKSVSVLAEIPPADVAAYVATLRAELVSQGELPAITGTVEPGQEE